MANLTLPTLDYVTTLTAPAVSTVIIYDSLLTGAAVMALPDTDTAIKMELAVDGEGSSRTPLTDVAVNLELGVKGECETVQPTTTNTPTKLAYGLKGIV